jgi:transposase
LSNHQNSTPISSRFDIVEYFNNPDSQRQKQYEAVRSIVIEKQTVASVAKRFGYKLNTVYSLVRDVKARKIALFPTVEKGPKQKRTPCDVQDKIIEYRKHGHSTTDIYNCLLKEGINISPITVERVLKSAGFAKLKRRTNIEIGKTCKNKIIPERSEHLDFGVLEEFNVDCPSVGVFFFIPYILESGILDLLQECKFNNPQQN